MLKQAIEGITTVIWVILAVIYIPVNGQVNNAIYGGSRGDGHDSHCLRQAESNLIFGGGSGDGYDDDCFEMPSTNMIFEGGSGDGYHAFCFEQFSTNLIFGGGNGDGFHTGCFKQSSTNLIFAGGSGDGFSAVCFRQWETNLIFGGSHGDGFVSLCYEQSATNAIFAGSNGDGFDAFCFIRPDCGIHEVNKWIGPDNAYWYDDPSYWSLNRFPTQCDHVLIESGKKVKVSSSQIGQGYTLEIQTGGILETEGSGQLIIFNN